MSGSRIPLSDLRSGFGLLPEYQTSKSRGTTARLCEAVVTSLEESESMSLVMRQTTTI